MLSSKFSLLVIGFLFVFVSKAQVLTLQPDPASGKDAFINDFPTHRNLNFGTNDQLSAHAGTTSGSPFIVRGLIEFDLSTIPTGMKVDSAFLSLYAYTGSGAYGTHRNSSGSNAVWIQKVTSAWNEMAVTWNNAPSTTSVNQVALPASTNNTQDYLNISVTNLVDDMYQNPSSNFGFQLMLQNEAFYRTLNFYSSDANDSLKRPKLVVYYSPITTSSSPVTLQPGPMAGKDAFINNFSTHRNLNFGTNDQLPAHAGTTSGSPFLVRGLVEFDLSSIPSGMKIDSAFLSLYAHTSSGSYGTHRNSSGSNAVWIQKITSAWGEMIVTWNNAPSTTSVNQIALPPSTNSTQDYPNINVTTLVNDMYQNPSSNFGFQLMLQNEAFYRTLNFYSSDATNSLKRPKLVIHYSPITTSLPETSKELSSYIVYPNPAQGFIKVALNKRNENHQVSILDISGKIIRIIENYISEQTIDIGSFSKGVYFIRISDRETSEIKKILVQ